MIKLLEILENKVLLPRRVKEREKGYANYIEKIIQGHTDNIKEPDVDLTYTRSISLPDNFTVRGSLDLSFSKIAKLPDNLKVGVNLILRDTEIKTLPDNLQVGSDLRIFSTKISTIPNNLKVGNDLIANHTPLAEKYTAEQIQKMVEDRGGYIGGRVRVGYTVST